MIEEGCILHLTLNLQAGTYHFASSRPDFRYMSYGSVIAMQNVLVFNFKYINYIQDLSLSES